MKRTFALFALLGLVIGTMLTGCEKPADTGTTSGVDTNTAVSTNK